MADGAQFADLIDLHGALGRGRPAKQVQCAYVRDLTEADLFKAATEGHGQPRAPIKALKQTHHQVAKLLAQGIKAVEISLIVGMTPERITQLKADPSFEELLTYYEGMEAEAFENARADMHERLRNLGFDAIETLHQDLIDDPEKYLKDPKLLLSIVEAATDRIGHGKTSTVNTNVSHNVSDETLARIRQAVSDRPGVPLAEEDRGALLRLAHRATDVHSGPEAEEGLSSEGGELREPGDQGASGQVIEAEFEPRVPSVGPVHGPELEGD